MHSYHRIRLMIGLILGVTFGLPLGAQERQIPPEPQLQMNLGGHTAPIRRVARDAAGKFILTGSLDKTAKLWDADTGQLIRTLRIPLAPGNDGQINAVALSPDGRTAVLGGWTWYGLKQVDMVLFYFEVSSGKLLGTTEGIGNNCFDLEFSPQGSWLAVATGRDADNLIVNSQTRKIQYRLKKTLDSYAAAWAPDGRLALTSWDGWVRVYNPDFTLHKEIKPTGGKQPHGLAWNPQEDTLAVSFNDTSQIQVLNARTLALVFEPNTREVKSGKFFSLSWSLDGQVLLGGGSAWNNGWILKTWNNRGRDPSQEFPLAQNSIMDIKPLPQGDWILGTFAPELVRFNLQGQVKWAQQPPIQPFNANVKSHLKLNSSGDLWGVTPWKGTPWSFNLSRRSLSPTEAQAPGPNPEVPGMGFTDFLNSLAPRLQGKPLTFLGFNEISRSASVNPTGTLGILGSEWNIYGVTPQGTRAWSIPVPGVAWAVNISESGKTFLAALGDGTLRWYRARDGAELLALFVHPDLQRWVLWTPAGYFDASPGGESLIGWHVNRGLNQTPDFFPAATFRDRFYRPDIVQEILTTLDESQAVTQANQKRNQKVSTASLAQSLPPSVRILSPDGQREISGSQVTLDLELVTAVEAPITDLQVRINGRPQAGTRGVGVESDESAPGTAGTLVWRKKITLNLEGVSGKEIFLSVLASNRFGFGPPADLTLKISGPGSQDFIAKPKLYVLAIGVSQYKNPSMNLRYAAKDAQDFAALVKQQAGGLYREVEMKVLTNQDATFSRIRDAFLWLEEQVTAADMAQVFIAGHGINDNTGQLYFAPYEVETSSLRRTGFPASDIVKSLGYLQGRVVYFMDTCHSGNLDFVRRGAAPDLNRHIQDLTAAETGAVVFSSAAGSQYALESAAWGNGAFTKALLTGLRGPADYNKDGAVSINELNLYVAEDVKKLTNNQQTPILMKPNSIRDFPLALIK